MVHRSIEAAARVPHETSNTLIVPINIRPGVWALAGERNHTITANTYSIGRCIFDPGAGNFSILMKNLLQIHDLKDIQTPFYIFLTHPDIDHTKNTQKLICEFEKRGIPVFVYGPTGSKEIIAQNNPIATIRSLYPEQSSFVPSYNLSCIEELEDEDLRLCNDVAVYAVSTPGHTMNHMSYLVGYLGTRYLVMGDLWGGLHPQRSNLTAMNESTAKILTLHFDYALESHGYPEGILPKKRVVERSENLSISPSDPKPGFRGMREPLH